MIRHLIALALALTFLLPSSAEAQYHLGPRGGCYTLSTSGRKQYVDRSLCSDRGGASAADYPRGQSKYHRGPRGGCYLITSGGNKRYVDRSLCR